MLQELEGVMAFTHALPLGMGLKPQYFWASG